MRPIAYVCLAIALAIPSVAHAGQVYGTIVMDGKGLAAPTSRSRAVRRRQ